LYGRNLRCQNAEAPGRDGPAPTGVRRPAGGKLNDRGKFMLTIRHARLAVLFACAALAGCATSRSEIKLKQPPIAAPASGAKVVVVRSVTDERVFEEAPAQPSTPSLGFGGAGKASADVKARAVARKRNGWGKAMGDVLLENGDNVEGVVRQNFVAALQQAGYQVKNEGEAGTGAVVMDVHIKKLWAWLQPGAWVITLSSEIATDVAISGQPIPTSLSVRVEDAHGAATENAWKEIVDKALDAYRTEVSGKLRGNL
jgi:hypothetical protein